MNTYIGFYDGKKSNFNFLTYVSNLTTQSIDLFLFMKMKKNY